MIADLIRLIANCFDINIISIIQSINSIGSIICFLYENFSLFCCLCSFGSRVFTVRVSEANCNRIITNCYSNFFIHGIEIIDSNIIDKGFLVSTAY